jgi:hypothetical protein
MINTDYQEQVEKINAELNGKEEINIKSGDIFKTSWGYDQTNYDFLIVLSISPTGKTANCQMISPKYTGSSGCSDKLKPENNPYGDKFRLKIKGNYLRGSYPYLPNGSKENTRYGYFSKADTTKEYYQTNSYFGH